MELITPRLRLRQWHQKDRESFYAINCEPDVQRHLVPLDRQGSDRMLDKIDTQFAEHGWGFWALEERESGKLIGLCGLAHITWDAFFTPAVEIGWRLSTPWQGKGLALEAAERALDFAFGSVGLSRVVSFTTPANKASWGLMERLGMKRIGEFDHPNLPTSHPLSRHVVYEITRDH
ncbi:GNAT family N-acetyltransferase [Phyllobacterium zundukense]|uniref:GNAT family N-acetyltransferase n=1 Tax=Phyllobacterium zundukense TaxID=1867719 RepID=A0ACD4CXA9_9HYPH|nr:GNAT family N-acetyltransferase [Phyllobacterium zundukense]UXN58252.1 GNAT family N-acetyltransferase [Phyllobacterium zundukense]